VILTRKTPLLSSERTPYKCKHYVRVDVLTALVMIAKEEHVASIFRAEELAK
jgi:hypothetical protein